jgi:hypothetical protein
MTDEPDLDLETPEADAYEQRQRVVDEDDDGDGAEQVDKDEFAEANEADVIEQRIPVRGDGDGDDYDA